MVLSPEEREALGRIISLSTLNKLSGREISDSDMLKIFNDTFKSILREISLKFYSKEDIILPFVGSLKIENSKEIKESSKLPSDLKFSFKPATSLTQEMTAILNNTDPPSKLELKQKIMNNFKLRLNFLDWNQTEDIITKLLGTSLASNDQAMTIRISDLRTILNQYID